MNRIAFFKTGALIALAAIAVAALAVVGGMLALLHWWGLA